MRHDYVYNKLGTLDSESSSLGRALAYKYDGASGLLVKIEDTSVAGHQALTSLLSMRPAARRGAILAIVLGVFLIVALAYWALRG